ncbi:unnamed protein product [Penicillium bialowiezense]
MSHDAIKREAIKLEEPDYDAIEGHGPESAVSTTATGPARSADRREASGPAKRRRPWKRQRLSQRRRLAQNPAQTPAQTDPVPQPRLNQANPLPEPRASPLSNITQGNLAGCAPRFIEPRSSLPAGVPSTSFCENALVLANEISGMPPPRVLQIMNSLNQARRAIATDNMARHVLHTAEREKLRSILTPEQNRPEWVGRVVAGIGTDLTRRDAVLDALSYAQNLEHLSRLLETLDGDPVVIQLYRTIAEKLFSPDSL